MNRGDLSFDPTEDISPPTPEQMKGLKSATPPPWSAVSKCGEIVRENDNDPFEEGRMGDLLSTYSPSFGAMHECRGKQFGTTANDSLADASFQDEYLLSRDMHMHTGAFDVDPPSGQGVQILDLMSAPGGFLATALEANKHKSPRALAYIHPDGPKEDMPERYKPFVRMETVDITTLEGPVMHRLPLELPEAGGDWLGSQKPSDPHFDIVLCKAYPTPTLPTDSVQDLKDSHMFLASKMSLALSYIRQGGNIVMMFRRVEDWEFCSAYNTFLKYCDIQLWKPENYRPHVSMFYVVARNVRLDEPCLNFELCYWGSLYRGSRVTAGHQQDFWWTALQRHNNGQAHICWHLVDTLVSKADRVFKVQRAGARLFK